MALSTLIAHDAHFIFVLRDAIPSKRDSQNNMEKERNFTIRLILTRSRRILTKAMHLAYESYKLRNI